jgi:peroxiredoxin
MRRRSRLIESLQQPGRAPLGMHRRTRPLRSIDQQDGDEVLALNQGLFALTEELGVPQDVSDLITRELSTVEQEGSAPGLFVGDKAPDFELPDATGRQVRLSELLREGPVVLAFYRGEWCPYCNLTLRTWQERLGDLTSAGGRLVAISPQRPSNALSITEKHELTFPVLSDESQDVIRAFKLHFDLPPMLKDLYGNAWGLDLTQQNADGSWLDLTQQNADGSWSLPVPGTFVIDRDRRIRFAFVPADYRVRAEPDDAVAALRSL